eukprot:CAMPEP_0176421250 /NCGR_PEP_ID=MMETSP0127-20121128/9062_1 /TAXON_ID=938130 /ORGANISM="Platyophrya macrostoma, Strain WH" /LENGTH=699 /DNA_ID=CAMNT_0017801945 /DNA_START=20 /DNA_END=2119 /DNA_ORIENTATION=-
MAKAAKIFLALIALNLALLVLYLSFSNTLLETNLSNPGSSADDDDIDDDINAGTDADGVKKTEENPSGLDFGALFDRVSKEFRRIAKRVSKVQKKTFHSMGIEDLFNNTSFTVPDADLSGDADGSDLSMAEKLVRLAENRLTSKYLDMAGKFVYKLNQFRNNLREVNVFEQLGAYEPLEIKYFNAFPNGHPLYSYPNMGLINDPNYCEVVDYYNLFNPENVFDSMNFFSDYHPEGLVRVNVMSKIGVDTMPEVSKDMARKDFYVKQWPLSVKSTIFFTKKVTFHFFHEIGKNFLCNSQMYNHIPGHGVLTRKDLIVESVNNYAKRYTTKQHCFNKDMFFPYAYRLNDEEECKQFFKEINSKEYQKRVEAEVYPFIMKIGFGAHRAKGVFLFDADKQKEVRTEYQNGKKCGMISNSLIAQKYVADPLTLDGHKFDFRIYMLIASTNPLIVFYHDGFLRLSLQYYNKTSTDKSVHLTNTHLSKEIFKAVASGDSADSGEVPAGVQGMNETELRDYQMWTMPQLEKHLYEKGKITTPNWLDNYLRPQFQKAFVHTARMTEDWFLKHSGVFEMFGLDFILDDQLNLWFIECNASPQLIGTVQKKTDFLSKMLSDLFHIQYAYLRSRMKRVHQFMAKLSANKEKRDAKTWAALRKEFKEINKNKLEPEFPLPADNSFTLIVDKSLKGAAAYFGHIEPDCVDDDE